MVRTDTSSSPARWAALSRPRLCSRSTMDRSRLARTSQVCRRPLTEGVRGAHLASSTMTNTDFDFLAGHWTSRQRRLTKVLAGQDDWYEFTATLDTQVLLDGAGVFDVLRAPERDIE